MCLNKLCNARILLKKKFKKSYLDFLYLVLVCLCGFCQKEEEKRLANSNQCSQAVTHPSTDWTRRCLTSVIGRELVYSA